MKDFVKGLFCIALAFSYNAAQAADGSNKDSVNWTGVYLGAYGTYNRAYADYSDPLGGHVADRLIDADSDNFSSFGGGVQAGYLYQHESLVIGAEVYGELMDANGCVNTAEGYDKPTSCPYGHSVVTKVDHSFGLNGKLGMAADQWIIYGLAGLNVSKVKSTFNDWTFSGDNGTYDHAGPFDDTIDTKSQYALGWRVGAGAELKITDQLSVIAQGTYTQVDSSMETPNVTAAEAYTLDISDPAYRSEFSRLKTELGIVAVNVGLNFRF